MTKAATYNILIDSFIKSAGGGKVKRLADAATAISRGSGKAKAINPDYVPTYASGITPHATNKLPINPGYVPTYASSISPHNGVKAVKTLAPAPVAPAAVKPSTAHAIATLKGALGNAVARGAMHYHSMYPFMTMGPEAMKWAGAVRSGLRLYDKIVNKLR